MKDKTLKIIGICGVAAALVVGSWLIYKEVQKIRVADCLSYSKDDNGFFKKVIYKVSNIEENGYINVEAVDFPEPDNIEDIMLLLSYFNMIIPAELTGDVEKTDCPINPKRLLRQPRKRS